MDCLLTRAGEITTALAAAHRELAFCWITEIRQKAVIWEASQERSASAREAEATNLTVDFAVEVLRVKGEIAAFTAELAQVDRQIAYRHDCDGHYDIAARSL